MISLKDIYWLAGIVDGEGYIGLRKGKYPTIVVKMTDRDIVQRVSDLFHETHHDVYICNPRLTILGNEALRVYETRITGSRAAAWLMMLYIPLGVRRRSKAKEVLSIWRDPNIGVNYSRYYYSKAAKESRQDYWREYTKTLIR